MFSNDQHFEALSSKATPLATVILVCLLAISPTQANVFDDLVNIVIDDLDAGENVVSEFDVLPNPLDLELEHSGDFIFTVDIQPLEGCDFLVRLEHFAPDAGIFVPAYDWQITDIHMRDENGEILFAKITDVEIPHPASNDMPTSELFFTDWVVSCRTAGFFSSSDEASNEYVVRVAVVGDVNGDCGINLLDVDPFIALLGDGGYSVEADINQDGALDLLDVSEFVNLLAE